MQSLTVDVETSVPHVRKKVKLPASRKSAWHKQALVMSQSDSGSYHLLFLSLKILKTILSIPGLDVNAKGPGGSTPLMQTVFNGRLEWIELLVEVDGIDLDVDLEKVGTTGGISIMNRFNEKKRTKILKCLTDARSKRKLRQRESEGEKKKEVL